MLGYEEIKELTGYLKFQEVGEFEDVVDYGAQGSTFYIIIKGLLSV